MRFQVTSIIDAGVMLGAGLGAVVLLGLRRVRRAPGVPAVVAALPGE